MVVVAVVVGVAIAVVVVVVVAIAVVVAVAVVVGVMVAVAVVVGVVVAVAVVVGVAVAVRSPMTDHTKLRTALDRGSSRPWRWDPDEDCILYGEGRYTVASGGSCGYENARMVIDPEDAELIVEAVNAADGMLAEIQALTTRRDELLVTIRKLSAETPYPEEATNAGVLIAEVGSLRAQLKEHERTIAGHEKLFKHALWDRTFLDGVLNGIAPHLPYATPNTIDGIVGAITAMADALKTAYQALDYDLRDTTQTDHAKTANMRAWQALRPIVGG